MVGLLFVVDEIRIDFNRNRVILMNICLEPKPPLPYAFFVQGAFV
jgi:hypothetical protein